MKGKAFEAAASDSLFQAPLLQNEGPPLPDITKISILNL